MKNYDIVVVGELNVDLILNELGGLPVLGQEILARQMMLTLGSSSAIFASNISLLGSRVAFVGKVGRDLFGDFLLQSLETKAVDTRYIMRDESQATGATVAFNLEQERAAVTYQGAMTGLTIGDIPVGLLAQSRHLHLSSVFLQPGLRHDLPGLFRQARDMGLTTSFDPQWDPQDEWDLDLDAILPYVDVFLPNESELLRLTGAASVGEATECLLRFSCISVVKQGREGATVCYRGKKLFRRSFLNETVVDAIGAGDSFAAGFIHEFLKASPIEVCHNIGNLMGAISTTAQGGTAAFASLEHVSSLALTQFGFRYEY